MAKFLFYARQRKRDTLHSLRGYVVVTVTGKDKQCAESKALALLGKADIYHEWWLKLQSVEETSDA